MKMNMRRWLVILPVALLGSTWALADSAGPDFQIVLDGFDPGQNFDGTANQETPPDLPPCLGTDCSDVVIIDPLIRLEAGGGSEDVFGPNFSFSAGPNGTLAQDFLNLSGQTFSTLDLSFTLTKDEYNAQIAAGVIYTCDGGPYFSTCGFDVVDPGTDDTINVDFSGGQGIPSTVPEPAQWMFLSLGLAAIVIARRKFRSNSAYSRN
jgi:hypothetical protein